jgi:hypothetical protein
MMEVQRRVRTWLPIYEKIYIFHPRLHPNRALNLELIKSLARCHKYKKAIGLIYHEKISWLRCYVYSIFKNSS